MGTGHWAKDLQGLHSLHDGGAAGDQVLHYQAALALLEGPLNRLLGAILLHLHMAQAQVDESSSYS